MHNMNYKATAILVVVALALAFLIIPFVEIQKAVQKAISKKKN